MLDMCMSDVAPGMLKWSFTTGNWARSPVLSLDLSTVYVGSLDDHLYALEAATGSKKWDFNTGFWVDSTPVISPVGPTIYVGSGEGAIFGPGSGPVDNGTFYSIEAATGKKKWDDPSGIWIASSPVLSLDASTVFVGDRSNYLSAYDAVNGSKRWAFQANGPVWSSPTLSADGSVVYIGSLADPDDDSNLYAIHTATGLKQWNFTAGGWVVGQPALSPDGSTVYVGASDNNLYAVDAATGIMRWSFATWGRIDRKLAISPGGTTVYAVSNGPSTDNLYAVDAATGLKKWSFLPDDPSSRRSLQSAIVQWSYSSSPVLSPDGSTVYFGSQDFHLHAVDAATGSKIWNFTTGAWVASTPALSPDGSVVYVGSNDNNVYAVWADPKAHDMTTTCTSKEDQILDRINTVLGLSIATVTLAGVLVVSQTVHVLLRGKTPPKRTNLGLSKKQITLRGEHGAGSAGARSAGSEAL